jgi:hypothetical protein
MQSVIQPLHSLKAVSLEVSTGSKHPTGIAKQPVEETA